MSAREYILLFHAQYVYRYNKEKFVGEKCTPLRSYFNSENLKKIRGVTRPLQTCLPLQSPVSSQTVRYQ